MISKISFSKMNVRFRVSIIVIGKDTSVFLAEINRKYYYFKIIASPTEEFNNNSTKAKIFVTI